MMNNVLALPTLKVPHVYVVRYGANIMHRGKNFKLIFPERTVELAKTRLKIFDFRKILCLPL